MAVNIPPGFGQAALIFQASIGTPAFVTTVGVDLGEAGGDYVAAANKVMETYSTVFMPTTSNALNLVQCLLTVGQDGQGLGSVSSDLDPVQGGDNGNQVPINLAVILRKNTTVLGRRGRGRMFLPGVANQSQVLESGRLTSEALEGLSAAGAIFNSTLRGTVGSDEYPATPPVLLHKTGAPTPIQTFTCAPIIGVVRKRVR